MSKMTWDLENDKAAKLTEIQEGWEVVLYQFGHIVAYNIFSQYIQATDEIEDWFYPL